MSTPIATVEVPASSANLGSGLDCFAAALSLKLRAVVGPAPSMGTPLPASFRLHR
jgi:homoserine kinase